MGSDTESGMTAGFDSTGVGVLALSATLIVFAAMTAHSTVSVLTLNQGIRTSGSWISPLLLGMIASFWITCEMSVLPLKPFL